MTSVRIVAAVCVVSLFLTAGCNSTPVSKAERVDDWRLGTSPWSEKLATLDKAKLAEIESLGFDCIEVGLPYAQNEEQFAGANAQAERLAETADEVGIEIWSVHIPYGPAYDPSLVDDAARAKAVANIDSLLGAIEPLGAKKAILHASFEPVKTEERAAKFAACKASLKEIADIAAGHDIAIAVECLPRTCLGNTSTELLELVSVDERLEICCDTNHLLQETTEEFVRAAGHRITTLHIADYDAKDERHWLPGKGVIDWMAVMDALVETGYTGPFLFECRGTSAEEAEVFAKLKAEYMERVAK
ncbi:L-xylulose 5-phosphate 3-epimerase [Anaerohalosphaera lusitana]|uniref:L-xylulose 5-phosphate 3-epimerase n=1 Tax=Anaerohalosphaera lusitana TaxID=1936003 RepID=A0A1U9NNE8_9BACT|nr:sugar phosphate isomerase/epimerase family protein [Anaerohalosphaera lusitana]AQT69264.1 L-xylulose 5-phosphate 3-epimerase [Anaerohalosphaera lusitana]